jgi:hypothetical protein
MRWSWMLCVSVCVLWGERGRVSGKSLSSLSVPLPVRTPFTQSVPRERQMKEIERERERERERLHDLESGISETEIGRERERERKQLKVKTIDPPLGSVDDFILEEVPDDDCILPGGMRNTPIPIDGPSLPICMGYGPGFEPPYMETTRSYLTRQGGPQTVSEVFLCAGYNPGMFLRNPMRCLIGGDRGLIATFVDAFVDDGLVLQLASAILAPLAAEFFWAQTPFPLVEKAVSFVCMIVNFVESIFGILNDIFGVLGGRRLISVPLETDDKDVPLQVEMCWESADCKLSTSTCWQPVSTKAGLCLDTAAMASGLPPKDMIHLYAFIMKQNFRPPSSSNSKNSSATRRLSSKMSSLRSSSLFEGNKAKNSRRRATPVLDSEIPIPLEDLTELARELTSLSTLEFTNANLLKLGEQLLNSATPEKKEQLSAILSDTMSTVFSSGIVNFSNESVSFDPEDPTHRLLQEMVLNVIDVETGEIIREKLEGLKEITNNLHARDILTGQEHTHTRDRNSFQNVKSDKVESSETTIIDLDANTNMNLNMNENNNNAIKEEFLQQINGVGANAEVATVKTRSQTCAGGGGSHNSVCNFIESGIAMIKKTVMDFIKDLIKDGIKLITDASSSTIGTCITGAISLALTLVDLVDPLNDSSPIRLIFNFIVDIIEAFMVELLFGGSCDGRCADPAAFDEDPFCCLPSRTLPIKGTADPFDSERIVLNLGCDDNLLLEMDWIVKLISLVIPLVEAGADAVIPFVNVPFPVVKSVLEMVALLAGYLQESCDHVNVAGDRASIIASVRNMALFIDQTTCRPTDNGESALDRRGYGCDGKDNDCNFIFDDCAEDNFNPEFQYVNYLEPTHWFLTAEEAIDTISSLVTVSDDCYEVEYIRHDITGKCENSAIPFTVTDSCENPASITVPINLDLEDPVITCDVEFPDLGWQRSTDNYQCGVGGIEPCVQNYVDVGLIYSFSDDCGVKTVSISVKSDEFSKIDQDAFFVHNSDGSDSFGGDGGKEGFRGKYTLIVNQREVWSYGGDCKYCVGEQTFDGRVYEIKITVEDLAGKKTQTTCPLLRIRDFHQNIIPSAIDSGLRFPVTEISYRVTPDVPGRPTSAPTIKEGDPTPSPSKVPTLRPSRPPTLKPTFSPSRKPTLSPSVIPSRAPTLAPSRRPSFRPSTQPSRTPTNLPTAL